MANENNPTKKVSRSEKTHAKNQENLHIALSIVESVGEIHDPTNPLISKLELTKFEDNFIQMSNDVQMAVIAEESAVDAQIAAFKPVSKRITLIMKAVRSQNLDPLFVDGLQADVYRLNAVKISRATPDTSSGGAAEGNAPRTASVSRRSYAGILESLGFISGKLSSNPAYNPNEVEFKSASIANWVTGLQNKHNAALEAKVNTREKRNTRNAYVYHNETGLIARMNALKNYLGYILDKNDPRLKQLKSLKFVDNTK